MKLLLALPLAVVMVLVVFAGIQVPSQAIAKVNEGRTDAQMFDMITAPELLPASGFNGRLTYDDFDPQMLERWLEEKYSRSPMRGTLADMVDAALRYDVNPAVMLGIACHETDCITNPASAPERNNPFGIMAGSEVKTFASLNECYTYECINVLQKNFISLHFPGLKEISYKYTDWWRLPDPSGGYFCGNNFPCGDKDWSEVPDDIKALYNHSWLYEPNGAWTMAEEIYKFCRPEELQVIGVDGLYFPCAGPCEFRDSWGDSRGGGTRRHKGCDIMAKLGTPAVAICSGTITYVKMTGESTNAGNYFGIQMDGATHTFLYMHMDTIVVAPGQHVEAGQLVGTIGSSGNAGVGAEHIHFEYHPNGGDAVDPYPLLKAIFDRKDPQGELR